MISRPVLLVLLRPGAPPAPLLGCSLCFLRLVLFPSGRIGCFLLGVPAALHTPQVSASIFHYSWSAFPFICE